MKSKIYIIDDGHGPVFVKIKRELWKFIVLFFYSVLNAITGSFLDAALAGIKPPIKVSTTLNITSAIALLI